MTKCERSYFLRNIGDYYIWFYNSKDEMTSDLEPIDVENNEFEVWDNHGHRVILGLAGKDQITVEIKEETSAKEEVLKAFADFASASNVEVDLPENPDTLLDAYKIAVNAVKEAWDKLPWYKRLLERF